MDDDQSGSLTCREFSKACKDFKVGISEENIPNLFKVFDSNGDGTMSYTEFLFQIRGEMSPARDECVRQAFQGLVDRNGGEFTLADLKKFYDAHRHPDVIQGKRTKDNVLVEFIETYEAHHNLSSQDPAVEIEQFCDYFTNISALYESDSTFINVMKHTLGSSESAQQA